MSTQEFREEVLLNTRCIVKGYHLCHFEVNVGEVFTASKKRGERGNVFKVVSHSGQLGHLQSDLVDPLMLLLLAISLFANVELLLPEFFCEGTMQPLSVFKVCGIGPFPHVIVFHFA